MPKCGIYALRNRVSGKLYVGQSVDIDRRWRKHKGDAARGTFKTKLLDAIRAYGPEAFELCVLELCDRSELNEREVWWIAETDALANGYNHLSGGGQGERELCPETRERYRAAQLGKKRSAESLARASASLRGRTISAEGRANMSKARKGVKFSDEHRARISLAHSSRSAETLARMADAQRGKTASPEAREKMSAAHKGVPKSPEHRAKIAAAHKGLKHSPETRAAISAGLLRSNKNRANSAK